MVLCSRKRKKKTLFSENRVILLCLILSRLAFTNLGMLAQFLDEKTCSVQFVPRAANNTLCCESFSA